MLISITDTIWLDPDEIYKIQQVMDKIVISFKDKTTLAIDYYMRRVLDEKLTNYFNSKESIDVMTNKKEDKKDDQKIAKKVVRKKQKRI